MNAPVPEKEEKPVDANSMALSTQVATGFLSAGVLRARWLALTFPNVRFHLGGLGVRPPVKRAPVPKDGSGES